MSTEHADPLIDNGKVMGLLDHLGELRTRLMRSLLVILACFILCLAFSSSIINFLKAPLTSALPQGLNSLHFTGPLEVFIANIKVSFLASFILACPIWIYQFWKFLEPALYESERRYIVPFVSASIALFFSGVLFSYYLILPLALNFLIELGMEIGTPIITISDYLSLLIVMILGFGIIFETPLVLILLASLDILNAKMLKQYRKFVVVGILIVAALLTPPDPLSQIGMAVPIYIMYEASIIIIGLLERRKAQK